MFGNSDEKATARAECERFSALPVAELAAAILPAFGPDAKRPANGPIMAADWLVASYPRGVRAQCVHDLVVPVRAAIEALLHAGLLGQRMQNTGGGRLFLTSAGETALARGNARQYLEEGMGGTARGDVPAGMVVNE
jgi:hypothetical protein